MKKILLITPWYPKDENDHHRTKAIANFIGEFKNYGYETTTVIPRRTTKRIEINQYYSMKTVSLPFCRPILLKKGNTERWIDFLKRIVKMFLFTPILYNQFNNLRYSLKIKQYLLPIDEYDMVLLHGYLFRGIKLLKYLNYFGPINICYHFTDYKLFENKYAIDKYKERLNKIAFRSSALQNLFFDKKIIDFIPKENTYVASSGIDQNLIVSKISPPAETLRIITVSSLIPRKRISLLVQVISSMRYSNWSFDIIGDGPEREDIQNLITSKKLSNKISIHGRLDHSDVLNAIRSHDVFVLLSKEETFGLVYLEALASGLIVIGSRGEGIDGVIKHGVNGFLLDPDQAEELSELLYQIKNMSSAEYSSIAQEAVNTAKNYTNKVQGQKYLQFLTGERK
jgi:glycosyltransferase involved in cell wall biosynthesis